MTNPAHSPDCVHCRWMARRKDGTYICKQHQLMLHSPVRLFCKSIEPSPDETPEYRQWFDQAIKPQHLQPNMMYIWLETITANDRGQPARQMDQALLAPFSGYKTWSSATFWEVVRAMLHDRREFYREQGYNVLNSD